MEFKDYYAELGVPTGATQDEIKRAYRKLARKYHPDVSQEPQAEARFKAIAEAHEALIDTERRAAYDEVVRRHASGQRFEPPPGWDSGYEYSGRGADASRRVSEADFSEFFESLFGGAGMRGPASGHPRDVGGPMPGQDHHAKLAIELLDACQGALRRVSMHLPVVDDSGHTRLQDRQLDVDIPKGIRPGQRLRLAGQGAEGRHGGPAGDLFLEIRILPHPVFRLDGADIRFDLPVSPWEAALGAEVTTPTPDGSVQLTVPPGSSQGRQLRLKGRGLPGRQPGDLYAILTIALPPAASEPQRQAYNTFAHEFAGFDPRAAGAA
jgi:curved DNA-binding protein